MSFFKEYIKIGFTGTQSGMTLEQKKTVQRILLSFVEDENIFISEVHHGDCIGADENFHKIIKAYDHFLGIAIHIHPPIKAIKRAFCDGTVLHKEKSYLVRNHDIVDACNVMIATPGEREEQLRSGTWSTIRYAKKCDKALHIIYPDGIIR